MGHAVSQTDQLQAFLSPFTVLSGSLHSRHPHGKFYILQCIEGGNEGYGLKDKSHFPAAQVFPVMIGKLVQKLTAKIYLSLRRIIQRIQNVHERCLAGSGTTLKDHKSTRGDL